MLSPFSQSVRRAVAAMAAMAAMGALMLMGSLARAQGVPLGGVRPKATPVSTGEPWSIIALPQSSLVYARDGSLIGEIGRQWRTSVALRSLPKHVYQAFVAVEDHRFYQHDGVDMVGVAGAIKGKMLGQSRGGASTITQQLVGNLHPDQIDRRDKSALRKLREQRAAREMEKHYNKEQILEAYLNCIAFGHGWYGIESAARHYFGKPASRLTLAEAASLAALPKGPAIYDPARNPDKNRARRNLILDLMVDQKLIATSDADAAKATPVQTDPGAGVAAPSGYFVDVVKGQAEAAGIPVSAGGYKVYTTLEPALQRAAVSALVDGTAAVEARPGYTNATLDKHPKGSTDYLQGMAIAIDPTSGDVKALVGGRNYQESQFNRAVNGMRQPGSSFKPIVYARAIGDSIPPNTIVPDTNLHVMFDRQEYSPKNSDGLFLGNITLREAITKSRNPVAVQLWLTSGPDSVIALARRLGISTPIAPYPSSAIGASEVQPLDFVVAYTAFANLGTPVEPRFVYRVEDAAGKTLWGQSVRMLPPAMDASATFVVRDMMRDVVERGTATIIRKYLPITVPVAGKTGTTDDNADVWFVGLTPEIVGGVWLGMDKRKPIAERGVAGGTLAAPIWAQMIARGGYARPSTAWAGIPAGVVSAELDRTTGALATPSTPAERRYLEYFLSGTEPGALRVDARRIFALGPLVF